MRNIRLILAAAASAMALQTAAAEHVSQWYISLDGGANFADLRGDRNVDTDAGWAALGAVGYKFANHLRLEGEIGYRHNNATAPDRLGNRLGPMDLGLSAVSFMGNAIIEVPAAENVTFGFGAGAGAAQVRLDVNAPFTPDTTDRDTVFAWQLLANAAFTLNRHADIYVGYRYMQTDKTLNLEPFSTPAYDSRSTQYQAHSITAGLRYYFNQPEEAPPAAPLPPPPPPPPQPKQFIVFFGFNKCNITAEADAVLSEAASAAKTTGDATVKIVGHTDTSGSSAYNQKLSECRANAAKGNLVGKGVPESAIAATGKGESELMVQTGDGIKEPQNRRATIDLN